MKKVLIAEDDKLLAQAYRGKFDKAGFEVKYAEDGNQVFEVLATFKPDVILLDLIMPLKDGFVVLEELKSLESTRDIPVIVTSNLEQQADIERCKRLGAFDYIVKSNINLDDLVKKIESL